MKCSPECWGPLFDLLPAPKDLLPAPAVDIRWRHVAQTLVVAAMVVVVHKGCYCSFQCCGSVVHQQVDLALESPVITLNLSVGLGVVRESHNVP